VAEAELIACHDCDLVLAAPVVPPGGAAKCSRCGAVLFKEKIDSLNRTLALTIAGLVLFAVANTFPFLTFEMQGRATQTTLGTGVVDLYREGMTPIAALVALTAIAAPAVQLSTLLYLLLPLRLGRVPPALAVVFRVMRRIQPWSMMEVFLLGILVSVVKLAGMADIVPGLAIWAFGVLILVIAAANASLDPRIIWRRVEELS
jgi:paraquat-inducible protein A